MGVIMIRRHKNPNQRRKFLSNDPNIKNGYRSTFMQKLTWYHLDAFYQTTIFSSRFFSKQGLNLGSAMIVIKYSKHIVTLLIYIISKIFFDGTQFGLFAHLRNKYGRWEWMEWPVFLVFCGCPVLTLKVQGPRTWSFQNEEWMIEQHYLKHTKEYSPQKNWWPQN